MGNTPSKLFIDSAALIALLSTKDQHHIVATQYYESLSKKTTLFTTLMIISETYTWFRYHVHHKIAAKFLNVIQESSSSGWLHIIYPARDLASQTEDILYRYQDQRLSYTDAMSFAVVKNMDIQDVFTFDSHFHIMKTNIWPIGL